MFYRRKIKELERRINMLENPFIMSIGDKVSDIYALGMIIEFKKPAHVANRWFNESGTPLYSVYSYDYRMMFNGLKEHCLTKKPKEDEDTKA